MIGDNYTKFQNRYAGGTCIIIGNGPSLNGVTLEFLRSCPTFGANNIITLAPSFVPTFYVNLGMNHFDAPEKRELIWRTVLGHGDNKACFLNRRYIHHFHHPDAYSITGDGMDMPTASTPGWSDDPLDFIGVYATITYCSLQIAKYMGFTTFYMAGVDGEYKEGQGEMRHFYDDALFPSFKVGELWGPQWKARQEQAMEWAAANLPGTKVVNVTRPNIPVFPYEDMHFEESPRMKVGQAPRIGEKEILA